MNDKELKLKIELVPATTWFNNLRKKISQSEWDRIRKKCYADYNYLCGICCKKGRLNCHEIWEYDDKNHIQTLKGFIALCDDCHNIKHFGFSQIRAARGKLDLNKLKKHFVEVNNCTEKDFKTHTENSFDLWKKRSKSEWRLKLKC